MLAPKFVGHFLVEMVGDMAVEGRGGGVGPKESMFGSRLWADRLRPVRMIDGSVFGC